ncbi:glycosyl hydrolase family protein [Paenibacillaceae bacterium]|nr:glycosyl hydrolase family protein [Paenibacillaceae bacterium]
MKKIVLKQGFIMYLVVAFCLGAVGMNGSIASVQAAEVDSFVENFDDPIQLAVLGYLATWAQGHIQWVGNNATVDDGKLKLTLKKQTCEASICYTSAQFSTFKDNGYGRYSASIKAAGENDVSTNLFVYSANEDWTLENIVETQVLGGEQSKLKILWGKDSNFQTKIIDLDFDASAAYHNYAFDWSADEIKWYVDDQLIATETTGIPENPGTFILNVMIDESATNYEGPSQASFDFIKYHKLGEPDPGSGTGPGEGPEPNPPAPESPAYGFEDNFNSYNEQLWYKSDNWANGPDFNVGWLASHVEFADGKMALRLDDELCLDEKCQGKPFSSGEYATNETYGYGRIEGRLKVAKGDGLVTSLFTYSPNADEIDIEILGKDTTKMETNYYIKGVRGFGAHAIIDLGFDASEDFHDYAIEWSWNYIKWYVDGELVRTVESNKGNLPSEPSRVMMNLWAGAGAAAATWTKEFIYPGTPVRAYYEGVTFTPEIRFAQPSYELKVGDSLSLSAFALLPGGGETNITEDALFELAAADDGTVSLSGGGVLKGLKAGSSVIKVTYQNTTALAAIKVNSVNNSGNNGGGGYFSGGGTDLTFDNVNKTKLDLKANQAGQINLGNEIKLEIPSDATDKDIQIILEKLKSAAGLVNMPGELMSSVYEVTRSNSINFHVPIKLTLKYDTQKLGKDQEAAIFYYDKTNKEWVRLDGIANGGFITADLEQFAPLAVFAVDVEEERPVLSPVTDIANHWAEAGIRRAIEEGFASRYADHSFRPDAKINRAEFIVMLVQALQIEDRSEAIASFTDVTQLRDSDQEQIQRAAKAGIIRGYEDGSFRPDLPITRAEMTAMIARALQLSGEEHTLTSFADQVKIAAWARPFMAAAVEQGILEGRGNNVLAPNDNATRAEAVTMLLRSKS